MTDVLDTIPNATRIRASAGATLNVQVTLKLADGSLFDTTGGTASSDIAARGSSGTPPVTEFATSLLSDSIIAMGLTSSQTGALLGTWHYRVWLDLPGPTRVLVCHGDLEVVPP
jgi:hypothetical protein